MPLLRRSTATAAAAAAAASLMLAGCGSNETSVVKAKVTQFARAASSHDYQTICGQVLAPQLLADIAAGGIGCQQAMKLALGRVQAPRLVIGTVKVSGKSASVLTLTQAKGEKTVVATVKLVKTNGGWRIDSLGSPVG